MNRLSKAKSPYLQQHAHNPVHWHEWGTEALEIAKRENKPLLISIGYAACHWCHVMEGQSFMDNSVADIMNTHFVSIKVDREERPDIDQIYMNAAQMITGSGGWPLNAFALPDGRPFYAGTYFPKEQWKSALLQLSAAFTNEHSKVLEYAENLTRGIQEYEVISQQKEETTNFEKQGYKQLFEAFRNTIDNEKGGFGAAPKFPLPVAWEFLLQHHFLTKDKRVLETITTTLDAMAKGGIYDQIGGGFARYSVDENWFAPHFEKMLYDNAQLVSLYANAYKVTHNQRYKDVIHETLAFVIRELSHPNGGFYSSLNADSEGVEGKFYVWKHQELKEILGKESAKIITAYYNVAASGNWEMGENILFRSQEMKDFINEHQLNEAVFETALEDAKQKLLAARNKRIRPSTDDKILCSWNALMLKAFIDAFLALGDKTYLNTALRNAQFIEKNMMTDNKGLWRSVKDNEAGIPAFLDDYANLAQAYISLYQATFDIHWLHLSKKLIDYTIQHFRNNESGLFYYTSDNTTDLIARKMEISDNVMPSSNSTMANVLFALGMLYSDDTYASMAKTMLNQVHNDISKGGPYYANWAILWGTIAYKPIEVAIGGNDAVMKNTALQKEFLPTSFFCGGAEENLPLLLNRIDKDSTSIYVCKNHVCQLPVKNKEDALKLIKSCT